MAATTGLTAAVGCLVVKELSSQAFALTLSHLSGMFVAMSRTADDMTTSIRNELLQIVPTPKLRIIQAVFFDFEVLGTNSKTMDSLCRDSPNSRNPFIRIPNRLKVR